jgi:hypothetical protein
MGVLNFIFTKIYNRNQGKQLADAGPRWKWLQLYSGHENVELSCHHRNLFKMPIAG